MKIVRGSNGKGDRREALDLKELYKDPGGSLTDVETLASVLRTNSGVQRDCVAMG